MIAEARKAFWVMVGVLAVLWIIQIFNALDDYGFNQHYDIAAHDVGSLPEIFTAPFLHVSWAHIESNSGPLFIFGFLAAYRGVRKFVYVSILIIVISGLGAWLFTAGGVGTVGASGVVFGYFGYIIVRGLFDRHRIDIVIGLVMALCFAYQFTAFLPNNENISWQGHVSGFVAGILGGWFFREKRRKAVSTAGPAPFLDPATTLLDKPKES
ncbi:MAG TPA: rhomboid family intramembrane serine protease [Pseudonocardiaceae bacterium]|jgi:membrane associated rhomboid family serine protease|nr:rhomboid family intramembrane serine protease [Pseudonocardiaceae bacterium]